MKVMMVNGLHLGGVRTVVDNVVSVLQKRHQISLFIGQDQSGKKLYEVGDHQDGAVHVRSVNIYKFRNARCVENYYNPMVEKPFREFLLRVKPDIVHFHSCNCIGASVVKLVKDLRIPYLFTMHDWWWLCPRMYLVDNRFEVCSQSDRVHPEKCYCVKRNDFEEKRYSYLKAIVEEVPLILVPSRYIRNSLVRNGFPPDKVKVNPNGIHIPEERIEKCPSKHLRFGFLGGSDGFKGGLILLKAAHGLRYGYCVLKMYNYKKASLVGESGGYRELKAAVTHAYRRFSAEPYDKMIQIKSLVRNRMVFKSTPHVSIELLPAFEKQNTDTIFRDIDVVVVPSVMRESYNLVTREALARNTPVICTDSGGPEEAVQDSVNGYVFRTNDHEQLTRIMESLVKNPSTIEKMQKKIDRKSIVTVESQALQLEESYEGLLQGS